MNQSRDGHAADERSDAAAGGQRDAHYVRLLDGEAPYGPAGDAHDRGAVDAARLETLARRSASLTSLLAAEPPTELDVRRSAAQMREPVLRAAARRRRSERKARVMRAAAALALLVAALAVAPPARAWIVAQARSVAAALGLTAAGTPKPAALEAAPGGGEGAVRVSFTVRTATLTIAAPAGEAVLVLRRGGGPAAHAETRGGGVVSFVVVPDGLRIEGAPERGTDIIVTLPPHVATVQVERPDGGVRVYAAPAAGTELRIRADGG